MVPVWWHIDSPWDDVPSDVTLRTVFPDTPNDMELRQTLVSEKYRVRDEWRNSILSRSELEPTVDAFASSDDALFAKFWTVSDDAFGQD